MALRIITINVNDLRANDRMLEIATWIKDYDVVFLQETHWTGTHVSRFKDFYRGRIFLDNDPDSTFRGVAICFRAGLDVVPSRVFRSGFGRFHLVSADVDDVGIDFVNIYAPNDVPSRAGFMTSVSGWCSNLKRPIIAGDFNDVLNITLDRRPSTEPRRPLRPTPLKLWSSDLNLRDPWRESHKDHFESTRSGFVFGNYVMSRIDYVFVRPLEFHNISRCHIVSSPFSDHKAVSFCVDPTGVQRGPGVWSFNSSLLQEERFRIAVQRIVERSCHSEEWRNDIFLWYENLKVTLKDYSLFYAKYRAQQRRKTRATLIDTVNLLESRYASNPDVLEEMLTARSALNEFDSEVLRGQVLRSKSEYREMGERPTSYFFRLEKYRQSIKSVPVLTSATGETLREGVQIRQEILSFYQTLFAAKETSPAYCNTFTGFV